MRRVNLRWRSEGALVLVKLGSNDNIYWRCENTVAPMCRHDGRGGLAAVAGIGESGNFR